MSILTEETRPGGSEVTPPTRRVGRHAGRKRYAFLKPQSIFIGLLGTVGLITILWLAVSAVFGLQLVEFLTGSMEPTAPIGAVAVERTVAAGDLEPGDIVTVHRQVDGRPVTHRVVAVAPGSSPFERILTLKGDANAEPDTEHYTVTSVGEAVVVIPWLGNILDAIKSPIGLGITAVVIPLGIIWALWPERDRKSRIFLKWSGRRKEYRAVE